MQRRNRRKLSLGTPMLALAWLSAGWLVSACADRGALDQVAATESDLSGRWQATLIRPEFEPDGEPTLRFSMDVERAEDGSYRAWSINGEERVPFSSVVVENETVVFNSDGYDSEITATIHADQPQLRGGWRKTASDGDSRMKFSAERGDGRFSEFSQSELEQQQARVSFDGEWTATFVDEDGEFPARGIFEQSGRYVTGTFRTTTGDYRYLSGEVVDTSDPSDSDPSEADETSETSGDEELRLSAFDGAHAFLFHARFEGDSEDEQVLVGDFWSRDEYHATWTAWPAQPEDELPNPFEQVGLTNDQGSFSFAFPDVNGEMVSSDDPRFDGKVVVVEIFGSWCPNCNDSAPYLASLYERYQDRGLEMVGLAYEMTGDFQRDAELVKRFAERHQIDYPLLVAGTSDKEEAAATLPELEAVLSFPTKVFIDRAGKVREIYSGFDGPSTGQSYEQMKRSVEELLDSLLAERSSAVAG